MSQKFKLLIADDEPFICSMLAKIIRCDELGIEISGTASDGEQLLQMIREKAPDIVITDISMPKMDGLEVIRATREEGIKCRFVIITGYQQYRYAYDSLRYDADDYLVKPVDEDELNKAMSRIVSSLRAADAENAGKSFEAIRAAFVENGIYLSRTDPLGVAALNEKYHLRLQEGLFQLLSVRLEQSVDENCGGEYASSIVNKLHDIVEQIFSGFCHDIAFLDSAEGVVAFLNYQPSVKEQIQSRFNDLLQKSKGTVNLFQGVGITVCIGAAVDETALLWQAKNNVRDAEWARIFYGTDRIIYSEELPSVSNEAFRIKLEELLAEFSGAFAALDIPSFKRCANSLFSCPMNVLRSKETRDFCRKLLDEFLSVNAGRIRAFMDPELMSRNTRQKLSLCTKVTAYTSSFISLLAADMEAILKYERLQDAGLFAQAEFYMECHCAEEPSLAQAAEELGTDAPTLYELVLRETGKNFGEYLSAIRIKHAQSMLKEGRRPDRTMATELGYPDLKSFKKEFKNALGVNPGNYRRIFQ